MFFKIISQFGDKTILGFLVYFSTHWIGKVEGFAVMSAFSLSVTALGTLKLFYTEGRPFFLNSDVHPVSCKDLEYGFPSGHATVTFCMYITMFYCMTKKYSLLKESVLLQALGFVSIVLFLILVAFSRIFVGVHSVDQLIVGGAVGTSIAIGLCRSLDTELLEARLEKLGKGFRLSLVEMFTSKTIFIFFASQLIALLFFLGFDHETKPEWTENIEKACDSTHGNYLGEEKGSLTPAQ